MPLDIVVKALRGTALLRLVAVERFEGLMQSVLEAVLEVLEVELLELEAVLLQFTALAGGVRTPELGV